jgi:hypothetical protein
VVFWCAQSNERDIWFEFVNFENQALKFSLNATNRKHVSIHRKAVLLVWTEQGCSRASRGTFALPIRRKMPAADRFGQ